MDSLCAIYLIAFFSGFSLWSLGLWRPPPKTIGLSGNSAKIAKKARKEKMGRNRLVWFAKYTVRFCIALIFAFLILNHLRIGLLQINTWDDFALKGSGYILTLWFLFSITSGLIRRLRQQPHSQKEDAWRKRLRFIFGIIFVIWFIYLCIRIC